MSQIGELTTAQYSLSSYKNMNAVVGTYSLQCEVGSQYNWSTWLNLNFMAYRNDLLPS